jgi:hypothetical protein
MADIITLRPGERLVRGKPYIYDLDVLNDWLAVCAKRDAPDDLSTLSDSALADAYAKAIRLAAMSENRDIELGVRIETERRRRAAVKDRKEDAA